jgi:hypothetical protein
MLLCRLTEQIEQAKSGARLLRSTYVSPIPTPLLKLFVGCAELSDLLNAEQTAAQATEAEALARAKTVRSNSCHDVL